MKKLSLGLALLGLSTSLAYAGGIDYEESGVFNIGVEGLYSQPGDTDLTYVYTRVDDGNSGYSQHNRRVDPDYDWGWHIDVGYVMPGDGPDFTLGWTQLDTTDRDNTNLSGLTLITAPDTLTNTAGWFPPASVYNSVSAGLNNGSITDITHAQGKTEYDYTDVDLVMGKEFVVQNRYHFHPFAGARYVNVEEKNNITYDASYSQNSNTFDGRAAHIRSKSEFSGIGPRAGIDASVDITNGFSIVARGAGSIVIGDFDWKGDAVNYAYNDDGSVDSSNTTTYRAKTRDDTIAVPEVDYRLGVNFAREFSPSSSFGIEAGWTGVHYFDVVGSSFDLQGNSAKANHNDDWAYQGPYVRFELQVS